MADKRHPIHPGRIGSRQAKRIDRALAFSFVHWREHRRQEPFINNQIVAAVHCRQVRLSEQGVELALYPFRITYIIRIVDCVKFSTRMIECSIERYGLGAVCLTENAHPSIGQQVLNRCEAAIRAAIIDDQNIEVPIRLPQDAQERRPKVLSSVIYTDHDGYEVAFTPAVQFATQYTLLLVQGWAPESVR